LFERKYLVVVTKFADKQLNRLPVSIKEKFDLWVDEVEFNGLPALRRRPGLHDEALKGERSNQRSVRLNRSYRVIYTESEEGDVCIVGILEVNKHDY
jgi:proteic killer suppression protein